MRYFVTKYYDTGNVFTSISGQGSIVDTVGFAVDIAAVVDLLGAENAARISVVHGAEGICKILIKIEALGASPSQPSPLTEDLK